VVKIYPSQRGKTDLRKRPNLKKIPQEYFQHFIDFIELHFAEWIFRLGFRHRWPTTRLHLGCGKPLL
jgi:hypothetical protein